MRELTINRGSIGSYPGGPDVIVHIGAWEIRKWPAHHLYAPPTRWTGIMRGKNGNESSVDLRLSFSIEYRTNNIDYIAQYGGTLHHDSGDKLQKFNHWSGSTDIRRVDGGEPTSVGRRVGCSLSAQVVEAIKDRHMGDVRDAAMADCLTECDEMKQRMMEQVEKWDELREKIETYGMEGDQR